ncbi:hypothetical protein [Halomonas sp. PBN3]|uniref:hypothetical protein n=1 Tax=Halomonas sp. PBN3 TaxID=1397528 RepID=UPI00126809DD|nr:hypothetical protein [Halomonas sp. PBN3]
MSKIGKRFPIGFDSSLDVFRKVERDWADLNSNTTPDALFNFVVTAHSLVDWVQNDPGISDLAKRECEKLAKTDQWLRACRDLANGSKHFVINRYEPTVEYSDVSSGYGKGRYGVGVHGQGEWSIIVSWNGGRYPALKFADHVVDVWSTFFRNHDLTDNSAV